MGKLGKSPMPNRKWELNSRFGPKFTFPMGHLLAQKIVWAAIKVPKEEDSFKRRSKVFGAYPAPSNILSNKPPGVFFA